MDILSFVSEIIKNAVWPATVLLLFFMARNHIGRLASIVRILKYKDVEISFGDTLREARLEADALPISEEEMNIEREPNKEEGYFKLALSRPENVIINSWNEVEKEFWKLRDAIEITDKHVDNWAIMNVLREQELIDAESYRLFIYLQDLRRDALDPQKIGRVLPDQIMEYRKLALRLAAQLRKIGGKPKPQ